MLWFLLISLIVIIVIGFLSFYSAKSSLEKEIKNHLETAVTSKAHNIEAFLTEHKNEMELINSDIIFKEFLTVSKDDLDYNQKLENLNQKMNQVLGSHESHYQASLLDKNGIIIASTDKKSVGRDLSKKNTFLKGKKGIYVSEVHVFPEKKIIIFGVAGPVVQHGEILGVLTIAHFFDPLVEITTERTGVGETGEFYLINFDKLMLTPSRFIKDSVLKQKVDTLNAEQCFEAKENHKNHAEHLKTGVFKDYRDVRVLGTHHYIPEMDWCLLAEVDEDEAFAPIYNLKNSILVIGVIITILASLLGFFLSNKISKPIIKLTKSAEIIGKGNLEHEIEIKSEDEIGELADSFNQMISDLKKTTASRDELSAEIIKRKEAEKRLIGVNNNLENTSQKLKMQSETLEKVNKKLKEFSALAAHELKVPINSVINDANEISKNYSDKLDSNVKNKVDLINKNANRSIKTIEQILKLAKSEIKGNLVLEPRDLNKLIKEIVELGMAPIAKKKNIEIKLNLREIPLVKIDEIRMIEVINNLINNAIKYTNKGGDVEIKTFKAKSNVVVEIKDTGIGISKDNVSKIFKKFFIIEKTNKESTGLGLSIVKEIVEQHGGKIGVKSVLGKGSIFWFSLPVKKKG